MTLASRSLPQLAVLFVCSGNICRSPTAEGVFRHLLAGANLAGRVRTDSAGLHDLHQGEAPDLRSQAVAAQRGYQLGELRARMIRAADFQEFDMIAAMDLGHLRELKRQCPPQRRERISLFLDFAPEQSVREIADPYYGGPEGFEDAINLCEAGARGLLRHIQKMLGET